MKQRGAGPGRCGGNAHHCAGKSPGIDHQFGWEAFTIGMEDNFAGEGNEMGLLENLQSSSERLERMLRLRTPVVGIKLLRNPKDIPEEAYRPDRTTVCQMTGVARYHDIVVASAKGNIVCPMGATTIGFSAWPEGFFETRVGEYSDDINAVKKMLLGSPQIAPNTFSAVVMAPLSKMPMVPDSISIYANTGQVLLLAYGLSWESGEELVCATTGHMGECSNAIAATYVNKKPSLALPCFGARRRGLCTDSEMVVGVPSEKFEAIVKYVERSYEAGRKYPIRVHGLIGYHSPDWPKVSGAWNGLRERGHKERT